MRTLIRAFLVVAATVVAAIGVVVLPPTVASADGLPGGTTIVCDPTGCHVVVVDPGGGGHGGGGGGGCSWQTKSVPCSDPTMGSFNAQDGCYYKEANPYPTTGPVALEYQQAGGGIYWATRPFGNGSGGYVWLPQPPAGLGPTPAELAQQAFNSLTLTKPSTGRYPAGTLKNGQSYTVVHAYTWYFSDSNDFKTLSARAAAGPVWAQVTVTPVALTFTPGDGNGQVSCAGPGTAWNSSYGVWDASPSGCDYRYPHSSIHEPNGQVTATYGINWQVTWVGSGNTAGTLPDQRTTSNSTFAVAEVESAVTG